MEPSVLAELPDDTLYHLLSLCSLEQVLRFRRVLGKSRGHVFAEVERDTTRSLHLEGIPLSVIYEIEQEKDADDALRRVLEYGDYPEYVESRIKQAAWPDRLKQYAMERHREKTSLILLKKAISSFDVRYAMKGRCAQCLRYIVGRYGIYEAFFTYVYDHFSYLSEDDLQWAMETLDMTLRDYHLRVLMDHAENKVSLRLLNFLLSRMSKEAVASAYEDHLLSVKLQRENPREEGYQYGDAESEVFRRYL